jgi:hypothetical protein
MNIKLVESLALVVQSLSPEERSLLEEKLKAQQEQASAEGKEHPFYETALPQNGLKHFGNGRRIRRAIGHLYPMKRLAEKVFMEKGANVIFD